MTYFGSEQLTAILKLQKSSQLSELSIWLFLYLPEYVFSYPLLVSYYFNYNLPLTGIYESGLTPIPSENLLSTLTSIYLTAFMILSIWRSLLPWK